MTETDDSKMTMVNGFAGKGSPALRPEFQAVVQGFETLTKKTDPALYQVEKAVGYSVPYIYNKYAGAMAVACFLPAMSVILPLGLLCVTVGLPIFLPVFILTCILAILNSLLVFGVFAISPFGRATLAKALQPTVQDLLNREALYQTFYETGPRPGPYAIVTAAAPRGAFGQLIMCLIIDFIGGSSYLVPLFGEAFDFIWAPAQMALMGAMFDSQMPSAKWLGFAEEILPFTDIIPSACLTWLRCHSEVVVAFMQKVKQIAPVKKI